MIQLKILSGKRAGAVWAARRFPVRVGRSANTDLQIDGDGVWDEHLRIELRPGQGFMLKVAPEALATLNTHPVQEAALANGDTVGLGSIQLQFWLAETAQPALRLREMLTWSGIAAVFLFQVAIIYWLVR
jgi:hypothetical protein